MDTAYIRDKWIKHKIMRKDPQLVKYLPGTYRLTKKNFLALLSRDKELFVKSVRGSGGRGVIKVKEIRGGKYRIHRLNQKRQMKGKLSVYRYFKKRKKIKGTRYIIQQSIRLARVERKPIDFRYIVQRIADWQEWVITGKHAKVAVKGCVVTNLQQGAQVVPVEEALWKSNIANPQVEKIVQELDALAYTSARCLSNYFPTHNTWGLDLAVDRKGAVWMIEANAYPLVGGFRYLPDLTMYQTINQYQAAQIAANQHQAAQIAANQHQAAQIANPEPAQIANPEPAAANQ